MITDLRQGIVPGYRENRNRPNIGDNDTKMRKNGTQHGTKSRLECDNKILGNADTHALKTEK